MNTARKTCVACSILALVVATLAWSQSGRGTRQGGKRPPGGGARTELSAEMAVGIVALSPQIGATDEQLLGLRNALAETYRKQTEIRSAMLSGEADFQTAREDMHRLHDEIVQKTAELLDDAQDASFIKTVQEARRPRATRRSGGREGSP